MSDIFTINNLKTQNPNSATIYRGTCSTSITIGDSTFTEPDWDIRWDDPNYYPIPGCCRGVGGGSPPSGVLDNWILTTNDNLIFSNGDYAVFSDQNP